MEHNIKYIIFIFFGLTLAGCLGRGSTFLGDPIIFSYSKEMKEKRGYWITGTGGSKNIESIFISFDGYYQIDISEGRKLYVEAMEGLLKKINLDKTVRPYLHNYPFTSENIGLFLGFVDQFGKPVKEPFISFISCVNGKIYYRIHDSKIRRYVNVYQEPYEEALRIVKEEQACNGTLN